METQNLTSGVLANFENTTWKGLDSDVKTKTVYSLVTTSAFKVVFKNMLIMGNNHPAVMIRNSNMSNESTATQKIYFDNVHIVANISPNADLNPGINIHESVVNLADVYNKQKGYEDLENGCVL